MCFPRNISCKDPNHILAAIQGISSSYLILSTVQLSKEGNTHLDSRHRFIYIPLHCQCNHDCFANSSTEDMETLFKKQH